MRALADAYNYALLSKEKLLQELGQGIAKRVLKRRGWEVYQMLAFSLPYFPRMLLRETFPVSSVTEESEKRMCWVLKSAEEMSSVIPLLRRSSYTCAGLTKVFQARSERVIRVVAKLMAPFEIVHEVSSNGAEKCYLNGMYVLATEAGELHFPKDNQRRELQFPMAECRALLEEIKEDARQLGCGGSPLSPGWWRLLGDEEKAREMEQTMANPARQRRGRLRRETRPRQPRVTSEAFEIDAIVSEKMIGKQKKFYLVRWSGYDVSWEPWRISGQPWEPIESWEPAHRLVNTIALQAWRERAHSN